MPQLSWIAYGLPATRSYMRKLRRIRGSWFLWLRYFEHAHAWLVEGQGARLRWFPPYGGRLKCNSYVAIRLNGSYIVILVWDFLSSICMVYAKRFAAMDPLVGKALAMAEVMELARRKQLALRWLWMWLFDSLQGNPFWWSNLLLGYWRLRRSDQKRSCGVSGVEDCLGVAEV